MSIMENAKKLNQEELEQINGGAGVEDKPYGAPQCDQCGTYDVRVYSSVRGGYSRWYGFCDKCRSEWDLEVFHQSPAAIKGSKSPL